MMQPLVDWTLAGTSRSGGAPPECHEADALVSPLKAGKEELSTPKEALLRGAADAIFQQAGYLPTTKISVIEPAPEETKPYCPHSLTGMLVTALQDAEKGPLPRFLEELAAQGLLIPPGFLPALLQLKAKEFGHILPQVIGERGRWLSQWVPDSEWLRSRSLSTEQFSESEAKEIWEEGTTQERIDVLKTVRRHQPALAIDWLAADLNKEKAEDRVKLLEALEINLSLDDETFLQDQVTDRSKFVKEKAVDLLAAIPGSEFATLIQERAKKLLQTTGKKGGLLQFECVPTQVMAKDWQIAGFMDLRRRGFSQKEVKVIQFLRYVPLTFWEEHLGADPQTITESAALLKEHHHPLLLGWLNAASVLPRTREEEPWHPALLSLSYKILKPTQQLPEALALLASKLTTAELSQAAELAIDAPQKFLPQLNYLLDSLTCDFPASYLKALKLLLDEFLKSNHPYEVEEILKKVIANCSSLTKECLPLILSWELQVKKKNNWYGRRIEEVLGNLQDKVRLQQRFYEELKKATK
ncbi:Hypothetical protein PBC10988_21790 [Planctomycetales bacterium 10988]|nr:Hypothetical protein PBC10988_21790 [Planctomycetales bacterium 10988]